MTKIIRSGIFANTYILERFNVCYIVDPSEAYEEIIEHVQNKEILGILLTHAHFDHTMLINKFMVPIYIHKDDAHLLFADEYNGFNEYRIKRPYRRNELNIRFLEDGSELPLGDHVIKVLHTPGHTKGSVVFLDQDKLISGDTLFCHGVGRYDFYSGNLFDLKRSVLTLINDLPANTKVYPGHGLQTSIKEEKKMNEYYLKWAKKLPK